MNKFSLTGEITAENIDAAIAFLEENKNEEIVCFYIDSPGGSVFDGLKLFRAMDNFSGLIIAEVGVMAASMAAFIALNCDEIHVTKDSFLMIHQAWTVAEGRAEDLRATADLLEQASGRLAEIVSTKAKDKEAVAKYMSTDTWFGYAALTEAFDNIIIDEENRFDSALVSSYALLKSNKPVELAAFLKAEEEKEEEDQDKEDPRAEDPEEDKEDEDPKAEVEDEEKEEETEEEPEEDEDKEEPKAQVDNTFAMSVLARAKNYI